MNSLSVLAKSRIKSYTKKNGTFVKEHNDNRKVGQAQGKRSKRTKNAGEQWRRKLKLAASSRDENFQISIEAPPVLREELGILDRLSLSAGKLTKILNDHPDLPIESITHLPELVADPLFVYERDRSSGLGHGEMNVVVEVVSKKGNPVLVGIARGEIRTITPRHDREEVSGHDHLMKEIGQGRILYARNKEALTEAKAFLDAINPGIIPASPSKGGLVKPRKQKILFRDDIVNQYGEDYLVKSFLAKARVRGYSRKDGTYVSPYLRTGDDAPMPAHAHKHPQPGEKGEPVVLKQPSQPSTASTWHNPKAVATFVPGSDTPPSLNGVPMTRWKDHPRTVEGWDYVDGVNDDLIEPPLRVPPGKKAGSGVVIEEPDGRVWIIEPSNGFGGYEATFPKGGVEPELSLQSNAIKEAFEESGLKVEITGIIGDYARTTSVARMYSARRIGGSPSDMGWESQSVSLVPKEKLYDYLNMWTDHSIAEDIGAGPAPQESISSSIR